MNKWLKIGLVGLLVAGVMGTTAVLISGIALAQESRLLAPQANSGPHFPA